MAEDNILKTDINEYKEENIIIDDQRIQFKKLQKLDYSKIEFKEYLKEVNNLIQPYVMKDITRGIEVDLKEETHLLRYYNMQNIDWSKRIGISGYSYNLTEKSDETGLYETERKTLTDGEKVNIVGFFKLPNNIRNLYYRDHIAKYIKLNEIRSIQFIKDQTNIVIKNHGLEEIKY